MSKQNTRATIDANIKQNGQQLITGQILNSVLNTMVTDYAEQAETTEKLTDLERKNRGLGSMISGFSYSGNINTINIEHPADSTPYGTFVVFTNMDFIPEHQYRIEVIPDGEIEVESVIFRAYNTIGSTMKSLSSLGKGTWNSTKTIEFVVDSSYANYHQIGCYIVLSNKAQLNKVVSWKITNLTMKGLSDVVNGGYNDYTAYYSGLSKPTFESLSGDVIRLTLPDTFLRIYRNGVAIVDKKMALQSFDVPGLGFVTYGNNQYHLRSVGEIQNGEYVLFFNSKYGKGGLLYHYYVESYIPLINDCVKNIGGLDGRLTEVEKDIYGDYLNLSTPTTLRNDYVDGNPSDSTPYGSLVAFTNIDFVPGHIYRISATPRSAIVLGGNTTFRLFENDSTASGHRRDLGAIPNGATWDYEKTFDVAITSADANYHRVGCYAVYANTTYTDTIIDWRIIDLTAHALNKGIKEEVEILESIVGNPASILTLNNNVNLLNQLNRCPHDGLTAKNAPLVLLHFSDLHGKMENLVRIGEYFNHYHEYINDVICTGDIVPNTSADNISFWADNASKYLLTIGNHEAYDPATYPSNPTLVDRAVVSEKFTTPFISQWGITNHPNGMNYWYKDYPTQKIRLIGLDSMYYDSTQNTWLINALNGARTNGYAVVIASHFIGVNMTHLACSFDDSVERVTAPVRTEMADSASAVQSFIDNGGHFVCWLAGHTHLDYIGHLVGFPKQSVIVIDTAYSSGSTIFTPTRPDQDGYGVIERVEGTKSQDLFNLVAFDTYRKKIRLVRVGADYDAYMRHKGTLCIDYSGDEPIVFANT